MIFVSSAPSSLRRVSMWAHYTNKHTHKNKQWQQKDSCRKYDDRISELGKKEIYFAHSYFSWAWGLGNITVTTGCGQRDPCWLCGQEEGCEEGGVTDTGWGRATNNSMRNLSAEDKAAELIVGLDLLQLDRHIKCSQILLSLPLVKSYDCAN